MMKKIELNLNTMYCREDGEKSKRKKNVSKERGGCGWCYCKQLLSAFNVGKELLVKSGMHSAMGTQACIEFKSASF
jgi:hypothetical protein